jgi:hypothetical protein
VLAEAIKRLSDDAIIQTGLVSQTLIQVNQSTEHLFHEAAEETEHLGARIVVMEEELTTILAALGSMNSDLMALLSGLGLRVGHLSEDIERFTADIDVHERVECMATDAMANLDRIVAAARELEPASLEFKDNLRHMEERYTMDSERHIHEAIARKRGGGTAVASVAVVKNVVTDDSEFGDNVDLF